MNKNITPIFEANMDAALRSHFRRTKDSAVDMTMPFDRLISFEDALRLEDDGIEDEGAGVGDYEIRQRVIGVRAFLRWVKQRAGVSSTAAYKPGPVSTILMQLFAAGRAVQDPFFSSISFTENGLLFSQTKAAASHRSKLISGVLKKAGAKGVRQPQQKTPEASGSYAAVQAGNSNRKGGRRQGSFLRRLDVKSKPPQRPPSRKATAGKPRQATFTRQLNAAPAKNNGTHMPNRPHLPKAQGGHSTGAGLDRESKGRRTAEGKTSNKKQRANEASVQPTATPTVSGQRISGGPAPARENGGGVTGTSRQSGAYLAQRSDSGCRSGGKPLGRAA